MHLLCPHTSTISVVDRERTSLLGSLLLQLLKPASSLPSGHSCNYIRTCELIVNVYFISITGPLIASTVHSLRDQAKLEPVPAENQDSPRRPRIHNSPSECQLQ